MKWSKGLAVKVHLPGKHPVFTWILVYWSSLEGGCQGSPKLYLGAIRSLVSVYILEGRAWGGGECSEKLPGGGASELQEVSQPRRKGETRNSRAPGAGSPYPHAGYGFPRHPTCLLSASACQSSFFFGLGTSLKTAAVQGTPRVPRGGRVWILNPRGQSGTRRPL